MPLADARERRARLDFATLATPAFTGVREVEVPIAELVRWVDWSPLFHTWELSGRYPKLLDDPKKGDAARKLWADAQALLTQLIETRALTARGVYGFFPAASDGDDLTLYAPDGATVIARMPMLRQQEDKTPCLSLADFVAPLAHGAPRDHVGAFAVTAGLGLDAVVARFEADHDDYHAIMAKALADRLAEAFAEYLHHRARVDWGYGADEQLDREAILDEKYRGIRPAFGYPACPDHGPKRALFAVLGHADFHGIALTESLAMTPTASVSGLYFAHPQAQYFAVGRVTREQVEDYAARAGEPAVEVERMIPSNLPY